MPLCMRYIAKISTLLLVLLSGFPSQALSNPGKTLRPLPVRFYSGLYLEAFTFSRPEVLDLVMQGDSLLEEREPATALALFRKALVFERLPPGQRTPVYIKMALAYEQLNNYDKATLFNFNALENITDTNERVARMWKAACYVNIGWLQREAGNYQQAERYANLALAIYRDSKPPYREKINALLLQANIAKARGQYEKINNVFFIASAIIDTAAQHIAGRERQSLLNMKNRIYNNIADTYLKLQQPDSALSWLKKTDKDFSLLHPYVQGLIYTSYGEAYNMKGDYRIAGNALATALEHSEQYGYINLVLVCNFEYSKLYERTGDYKKALLSQKKYMALQETFLNETGQNIQTINRLEAKYQLAKKDKELADKELLVAKIENEQKEKVQRARSLTVGFVLLTIILLVSVRSYSHKQKLLKEKLALAEKERRMAQIESSLKGEERERERIAKELHDGVMSEVMALTVNLQTLGKNYTGMGSNDDYRNIVAQSQCISQKLRETAHNLMPVNMDIIGLVPSIKVFLERVNSHKVQFTFQQLGDALPRLHPEVEKILLLSVMELTQNILKHANATEALVQASCHEGLLSLTVEDNGVGIRAKDAHEGLGLKSLMKHMELLHASLDIKGGEYSGTTILIELPLAPFLADIPASESPGGNVGTKAAGIAATIVP